MGTVVVGYGRVVIITAAHMFDAAGRCERKP